MRFSTFLLLVVAVAAALGVVGVDAKVKVTETSSMSAEEKKHAAMIEARRQKSIQQRNEHLQEKLRERQAKSYPYGDKNTDEAKAQVKCETCQMVTHVAMLEMWNHYKEHENVVDAREAALASVCGEKHMDQFQYSPKTLMKACKALTDDGTSDWYATLERMLQRVNPALDREDKEIDLTKPAYGMDDVWETERSRVTMCKNKDAAATIALCDKSVNKSLRAGAGLWEDDKKVQQSAEAAEKDKEAHKNWAKKQASDKKYNDRKKRAAAKRKAAKAKKYAKDL